MSAGKDYSTSNPMRHHAPPGSSPDKGTDKSLNRRRNSTSSVPGPCASGNGLDKPRSNDHMVKPAPNPAVIDDMRGPTSDFTPIEPALNMEGSASDNGVMPSPHDPVSTDQPTSNCNRAIVSTLPEIMSTDMHEPSSNEEGESSKELYTHLIDRMTNRRLKPCRPQPNPPPESGTHNPVEGTPGPAPVGSSTAGPKSCAAQDRASDEEILGGAFDVYRGFARHCPEFKLAVSNKDLLQLLDSHRDLSKRIDEACTAYRALERDHALQEAVLQECFFELERASPDDKNMYGNACKRAVRRLKDKLDSPLQAADRTSPPGVQVNAWIEAVLRERGLDFGPPQSLCCSPDKKIAEKDLSPQGPPPSPASGKVCQNTRLAAPIFSWVGFLKTGFVTAFIKAYRSKRLV